MRARAAHRDETRAIHVFRPGDFGTSDFAAIGAAPAMFATAQLVESGTLGWGSRCELVYDVAAEGLWAHAQGFCPHGRHDLRQVQDARVELSAPRTVQICLGRERSSTRAGPCAE